MLKDSKSLKIAKGLVELSLNEEGRVEPEKINQILTELKNEPTRRSLPILRKFLTLIKQQINTYEGSLEKFDSNADSSSNLISDNISQARGKKINLVIKENKSLIAGFRMRIGDDVYEDSIASRIARLKKSLT
ncbi:MAG: F0F1 ATP synthase subunit delta [Opitutales bacterium]|nr:F0F1 ATP synthase subunit delta [Opitutales bacterium]MDG1326666.1 F0F1 ATP synthase subunit delta [Opitutales bacterium]